MKVKTVKMGRNSHNNHVAGGHIGEVTAVGKALVEQAAVHLKHAHLKCKMREQIRT